MGEARERAAALQREIEEARALGPAARRRSEVIERAVGDGRLNRDEADEVYDLAVEESLDPAYALALARSGYWVRELVPPEPAEEAMQQAAPTWIEPPASTRETVRERRIRASLRRLRSLLEQAATTGDAVRAYLAEPDVGPSGPS